MLETYLNNRRKEKDILLMTHIVLAVVILPLAMTTLSYAVGGQIAQHKRVAPITFGLWVYVSLTGVLIYWMVHA